MVKKIKNLFLMFSSQKYDCRGQVLLESLIWLTLILCMVFSLSFIFLKSYKTYQKIIIQKSGYTPSLEEKNLNF